MSAYPFAHTTLSLTLQLMQCLFKNLLFLQILLSDTLFSFTLLSLFSISNVSFLDFFTYDT